MSNMMLPPNNPSVNTIIVNIQKYGFVTFPYHLDQNIKNDLINRGYHISEPNGNICTACGQLAYNFNMCGAGIDGNHGTEISNGTIVYKN